MDVVEGVSPVYWNRGSGEGGLGWWSGGM